MHIRMGNSDSNRPLYYDPHASFDNLPSLYVNRRLSQQQMPLAVQQQQPYAIQQPYAVQQQQQQPYMYIQPPLYYPSQQFQQQQAFDQQPGAVYQHQQQFGYPRAVNSQQYQSMAPPFVQNQAFVQSPQQQNQVQYYTPQYAPPLGQIVYGSTGYVGGGGAQRGGGGPVEQPARMSSRQILSTPKFQRQY